MKIIDPNSGNKQMNARKAFKDKERRENFNNLLQKYTDFKDIVESKDYLV
jgi:hypothetical protein